MNRRVNLKGSVGDVTSTSPSSGTSSETFVSKCSFVRVALAMDVDPSQYRGFVSYDKDGFFNWLQT